MVNGHVFRITEHTPSEWDRLISFLSKHGACLIASEIGTKTEKPHVHGVVLHELKDANFRVQLKKCLDTGGNEKYCTGQISEKKGGLPYALQYAMKEGNCIYHYGLDPQTPMDHHDAYWALNSQIKEAREKFKKKDWLELALAEVKEGGDFSWEALCDAVTNNIPTPSPYQVEANCWKLRRLLDPQGARDCMRQTILDKFPMYVKKD